MEPYISKSALAAEIEKKINYYEEAFNNPAFASYEACLIAKGKYRKLLDILQFINTLEVKEVDLKKEIEEVQHNYKVDNNRHTSICSADIEWLAKHFFELGINTKQKGE